MIYNYKEMMHKYESDYQLKNAVSKREVFYIEKGIYSDNKNVNILDILTKKYPKAIVTGDTAYYLYNLTDVIPEKFYLAFDRDDAKITDNRTVQVFVSSNIFNIGKTTMKQNASIISIYDKEKMLIELIKNKNLIPFDYYKEKILNYRNIIDELDIRKLEEYLKYYNNSNNVYDIIQREVF